MKKDSSDFVQFIADSGVQKMIDELKQSLLVNGEMPVFSDLIQEENGRFYQYANYVQEGGGVLGVGLVGYTYVLESLGIRFLKLAGTSAGAINTIMLASVNKENYNHSKESDRFKLKSEIILHEMLNYDFWKLVDGNWFTKALIRLFINSKPGTLILQWILIISAIIPIVYALFSVVIQLIFPDAVFSPVIIDINETLRVITAISMIILIMAIALIIGFFALFSRQGFGINPGNNFQNWIMDIMKRNHIHTAADLEKKMQQHFEGISLRPDRKMMHDQGDTTQIDPPYITIIASDITNQTKVEFPLMAKDYWQKPNDVNPADFVRASMSIPVFFEPFKVRVYETVKETSMLQKLKEDVQRMQQHSYDACFVDGGILSNFPINIFHNPKIKVARCPTFGVKLEDADHITGKETKVKKTRFLNFLGNIFSTVRFYYDRDFLKKNEIYEQCIAHVDVAGFNWLNFGLDYETKLQLFQRGAEAAKVFFLGGTIWVDGKEKIFEAYDWEKFKIDREKMVIAQNG